MTSAADLIDSNSTKKLQLFADDIYKRIPTVQKCIRELDGNDAGKIGWIITIGEDGMRSWRKRNPKPHATGFRNTRRRRSRKSGRSIASKRFNRPLKRIIRGRIVA